MQTLCIFLWRTIRSKCAYLVRLIDYGLRDYDTATWDGGDPLCDHVASERYYTERTAAVSSAEAFNEAGESNAARIKAGRWRESGHCIKCGSIRVDSQIGLEQSPQAYVDRLVIVFREVWRVLKDDGVLWLNLGDSYVANKTGSVSDKNIGLGGGRNTQHEASKRPSKSEAGLKPKDLIMIPARVAMALQADGWYLRSEIVWHKPNPMPESVTDRPTRSHEMIYLLSKQARYYYDAEAIKEASVYADDDRKGRASLDHKSAPTEMINGIRPRGGGFSQATHSARQGTIAGGPERDRSADNGYRNKRDVWTVNSYPYAGAHFATYPPELIKPCILAGSRKGDRVLDPFVGSGTTIEVCNELARVGYGLDLSMVYLRECAGPRAFGFTPMDKVWEMPLFAYKGAQFEMELR